MMAYNKSEKKVAIVLLEKMLDSGKFHPEIELNTGMEAVKIFYYNKRSIIVCGNKNVV